MNKNNDITLCLTIGKRPDELRKTLNSLFQFEQFEHILAINDFGDTETSEVFKEICPNGVLVDLEEQVGHHKAVDYAYNQITTPYVFHCEDDWLFVNPLQLDKAKILLESKNISSVCFRKISDFNIAKEDRWRIIVDAYQDVEYIRLDRLHKYWHGYTFNPHLAKIDLWKSADLCFAEFKKERHISRWQRKLGRHTAFIRFGACLHVGDDISVSHDNATPSRLKTAKRAIRSWLKSIIFYSQIKNDENKDLFN